MQDGGLGSVDRINLFRVGRHRGTVKEVGSHNKGQGAYEEVWAGEGVGAGK